MAERMQVTVNGKLYTVEIDSLSSLNGSPVEVRVNGQPYTIEIGKPSPAPAPAAAAPQPAVPAAAAPQPAAPKPTDPAAEPASGGGQPVTAPMPGKILSVAVKVGDAVKEKDTLCTLEAMKMEMNISSPSSGTVRQVKAQVGENVVYGDILFVIE